uniref:Putative ixodes 8-cys protein n=1 Tax=Ixodes ricinus TaxID=34613 RepID=A0A0K8R9Y2_IXORI
MFKLKFFILFLLAGLCFGNSSGSETVEAESSNGEATNDAVESKTSEKSPSQALEDAIDLPNWIPDKKSFAEALLKNCHNQNSWERINNKYIDWENCTYMCRHDVSENDGHVNKLPEDSPCGEDGRKCIRGSCLPKPTPLPIPSCR